MLKRLWIYERQNIRFLTNLYAVLAIVVLVLWFFCTEERKLSVLTQGFGLLVAGGAVCIATLVVIPHLFKNH